MLKTIFTVMAFLFWSQIFAQVAKTDTTNNNYNLDFEQTSAKANFPAKWIKFSRGVGYNIVLSQTEKHSGSQSLLIESNSDKNPDKFACAANLIPAKYLGKEIEFKAWLKFADVKGFISLFIRVSAADGNTVQFATLEKQQIHGTRDWQQYSIKATLPPDAQYIFVAPLLFGPGKLWIDDAEVLIDGKPLNEVPLNPAYNPHPPVKAPYGNNPAAGGHVKLKDANIYYETYGSGEPILLLHGNSQSIYAFNYQIADLAKKFKVIAVDSRGQGKSTDETTGALSYDLFADDMRQLLDSLHITKTNILGWSDGGNTGLIMAIKYPDRVNKLATMGANLFATNEAVGDTVLNEVRTAIDQLKNKNDAHSKMQIRLFTMLLTEPHMTFKQLKAIKAKVSVMAGEHDMILEKHTRAIAAAIPNSKLIIIKGATHYAPVDAREAFNKAVLDFMTGEKK